MTAAATRRHRHLLEAINAGAIPRLASGGPVLPARASAEITRPEITRPGGRSEQGGAVTNVFNITTPNPRAFAGDRVAVARGAARILEQARRFS